jgi:hypothetical protein
MRGWRLHLAVAVMASGFCALGGSRPASQAAPFWMSPIPARHAGTIAALGTGQSTNWSGYNQGFLEKGTPFMSVSGQFNVPTATRHNGAAGTSSVWVGIGGGCLESTCLLVDPTLIQAGTNSEVDANGVASYSTWWEIIPLPQITTPLAVTPGQRVQVDINQLVPEVWTITITNLSSSQVFTTTVPYPSSYGTAEWIVETPTLISTSGVGLASMPNLDTVSFSNATVNGGNPGLIPDEAIFLCVNHQVVAAPSSPGSNSFSVSTYPGSC